MRFVHTADWHLGRIFHGVHLTEDQSYVLDRLVEIVQDARPDVVIVAGDVYDRAVPPQDAVSLLDDVLSRLVVKVGVPVVVIAGNHDSPERLSFGARLLANSNLHVFGPLLPECHPVILEPKSCNREVRVARAQICEEFGIAEARLSGVCGGEQV